jgi:ribosome-binding factor A
MFDDMTHPGAFGQTLDQPAGMAATADMSGKARKLFEQSLGKSIKLRARPELHPAEIEHDPDHRQMAVKMRATVDGMLDNRHRRKELHRLVDFAP